jgi:hypothetical protein
LSERAVGISTSSTPTASRVVAGRQHHCAQQRGPGLGGQRAVGQAVGGSSGGEFAERLRGPQQKGRVAGEAVDVAGKRSRGGVGIGGEQGLDLGLGGSRRRTRPTRPGRLVEAGEVIGPQCCGHSGVGLGGLEQCGHRLPLSVIRSAQAAVRCIASRNAGSSVAVLAGCDQWAKLRTRRATPDSRRGSGVPTGSPTPGECRDLPTGPDASVTATPGRWTGSRRGWGDSGVRRNDGARGDRHLGLLGAGWEMTPFAGMTMSAE